MGICLLARLLYIIYSVQYYFPLPSFALLSYGRIVVGSELYYLVFRFLYRKCGRTQKGINITQRWILLQQRLCSSTLQGRALQHLHLYQRQLHLNRQRQEVVTVQICIEKMCVDAEQQKVPTFPVPVTYFLLFCSKSILHVSLLSDAEGSGGLYQLVSQTPLLTGFLLGSTNRKHQREMEGRERRRADILFGGFVQGHPIFGSWLQPSALFCILRTGFVDGSSLQMAPVAAHWWLWLSLSSTHGLPPLPLSSLSPCYFLQLRVSLLPCCLHVLSLFGLLVFPLLCNQIPSISNTSCGFYFSNQALSGAQNTLNGRVDKL